MALLIDNRQKYLKIDLRRLRPELQKILKYLNCQQLEVSLSLVDDQEIHTINREYLHRDKATNVISFSMREGDWPTVQPTMLGDIIISAETAQRDAQLGGIDVRDEIFFLFIHGLLHLLGFDHENGCPEDAQRMKAKEKEVFLALKEYELDHD
jgi:probable rRNA maturation factor